MYLDHQEDMPYYLRLNRHAGDCHGSIAQIACANVAFQFGFSRSTQAAKFRPATLLPAATPVRFSSGDIRS